jgi:3-hydroxyisobutyrate dehydrogenase-like beta-hydroxyacid dehydrogenase
MVNRLLGKGHTVTGYNRTRSKAQWLVEKGMKWADSPREVASTADFVFAMVTNAPAIASITEGPEGILAGMSAGKVFIDMSTISPAVSRALAAKVREKGADMVGDGGRTGRDVRKSETAAARHWTESDSRWR